MFEYRNNIFRVYGFNKIEYIDENRVILVYKHKRLFIEGKRLISSNFIDKSLEIKGLIQRIEIKFLGIYDD